VMARRRHDQKLAGYDIDGATSQTHWWKYCMDLDASTQG
jgi:hypothetical protein